LWSAYPALKNEIDLTREYIFNNTIPIFAAGCSSPSLYPNNLYGYGNIDIFKMLNSNTTTCFKIFHLDPVVCSGKGSCIGLDTCKCKIGNINNY
jgi:hypothetical protein